MDTRFPGADQESNDDVGSSTAGAGTGGAIQSHILSNLPAAMQWPLHHNRIRSESDSDWIGLHCISSCNFCIMRMISTK